MLKERNIAVYFEVEKINTLKDGEFLLTIFKFCCTTRSREYICICKKRTKNGNEKRRTCWFSKMFRV